MVICPYSQSCIQFTGQEFNRRYIPTLVLNLTFKDKVVFQMKSFYLEKLIVQGSCYKESIEFYRETS